MRAAAPSEAASTQWALLTPQRQGFCPCVLAGDGPSPWRDDPDAPLDLERLGPGPVLLQLFVRGNPFRGEAGSGEPWEAAVRQLLTAGRLVGLAVYGSPYLWEELRPLLPDDLPAIGRVPGVEGVLVATGHGTLGFTQAPITGRLVAELATGAPTSVDVEPFRPERF